MNRMRTATLLVCFVLSASTAFSAANKVFVSPQTGDDANACTLAAPCRQFTKALSVVNSGGDVIVLDSGGFQPFSIDIGVSILAEGVVAEVVTNLIGISVNAEADVTIRGLTITGIATSTSSVGIQKNSGYTLSIENCVVRGFNGTGIYAASGQVFVQDTIVKSVVHFGMLIYGTSTGASIVRSSFLDNDQYATFIQGGAKVSFRDSVASGNGIGFHSDGGEINIESCLAHKNVDGGVEANGGVVRVSNSTITDNGQGLNQMSGILYSRGNNTVEGNTVDTLGTITPYSPK